MKNRAVYLGLSWLVLGSTAFAQLGRIIGRTVYHDDKSRTESVSDPSTREMVETTYTADNTMTVKKIFLLNEKGEPLQGNVYDGRGNLVARCKCLFDEYARRKEDQLMNLNGEVFQRVVHEYDSAGKAKTPQVINLNASAPSIRPQSVDFTQGGAAPGAADPASRFAPVQIPSSPVSGVAPVTPPSDQKPKPSFFKRLFQKKEK
ncbi:MAG: hypothetical protein ABL974_10900 [Prosthecobacter sp.]